MNNMLEFGTNMKHINTYEAYIIETKLFDFQEYQFERKRQKVF